MKYEFYSVTSAGPEASAWQGLTCRPALESARRPDPYLKGWEEAHKEVSEGYAAVHDGDWDRQEAGLFSKQLEEILSLFPGAPRPAWPYKSHCNPSSICRLGCLCHMVLETGKAF